MELIKDAKEWLSSTFEMKDMVEAGEDSFRPFLISWRAQETYIRNGLERF